MLIALVWLAPTAQAAPAGAAPEECPVGTYAPLVPTKVKIDASPRIEVGKKVRIKIDVRANTDSELIGTLRVRIDTVHVQSGSVPASGSASQTYRYNGTPLDLDLGDRAAGDYQINVEFVPDDGCVYGASSADFPFTVAGALATAPTTDASGELPSAGGFSVWWLLLALGLLAAGGGVLLYTRRRKA
jgi:LPXTG-motif cell wall-anchored protein